MDQNATRPLAASKLVVYRCACGNRLTLDPAQGGTCEQCHRTVSARSLSLELSSTVPLEDENFELAQTQPGVVLGEEEVTQQVILEDDSSADATQLIGRQFGHFEIISPLGRGGMGQVYRALDTSLQRYVAVKVLRSGIGSSSQRPDVPSVEVDKLLQEAVAQARVSHPNIVTIYYVGKEEGNPFLAMELVNGPTLNLRIAAGDLTFAETARVGLELASALQASFDLDMIHGDLKPSNVLMTADGTSKLSDFGMARKASDGGTVVAGGTPNYLAPELLVGKSTSPQSDMYALGVTLYEMTFGRLPITLRGQEVQRWIQMHEDAEIEFPTPWPPQVPESWRPILQRLLARRPEDRYPDYEELIEDLERLQPRSSVAARFVPRLIAAGIDWALVLLMTIGVQLLLVRMQPMINGRDAAWIGYLMGVMTFLPMLSYLLIVYFWRQTIGRKLMHLRVVNQYSLRPTHRQMLLRSLMRMQFPWFVILQILLSEPTPQTLGGAVAYIISAVIMVLDLAYMLMASNGSSIHDRLVRTRVVLDTHDH